jgi:hypothetical protein
MSAYVCSDATINKIVTFLYYSELEWLRQLFRDATSRDGDFGSVVGDALFDMNVNAVEQRYGKAKKSIEAARRFRKLDYVYRAEKTSLVEVYDAVKELMYQCCEGNVPETALYKLLESTQVAVADQIINSNRHLLVPKKAARA